MFIRFKLQYSFALNMIWWYMTLDILWNAFFFGAKNRSLFYADPIFRKSRLSKKYQREIEFCDFQTWCLLRRSRCWKDYSLMPFVRSGFGFCIAHQSSESLLSLFWKGFLMMLPKVAERCQRVALSISKIFPLAFSVFRGHTDSISFKIFFPLASLLNSSLVSSQTFQQAFNEKFKMLQATQSLYWQNVSFCYTGLESSIVLFSK